MSCICLRIEQVASKWRVKRVNWELNWSYGAGVDLGCLPAHSWLGPWDTKMHTWFRLARGPVAQSELELLGAS